MPTLDLGGDPVVFITLGFTWAAAFAVLIAIFASATGGPQ